MDFSEWLTEELKRRGWSISEFARQADISQPQVTRVINREQEPGKKFLAGTASALDVSIEQLLRLVGTLPDKTRDPWVEETAYKLTRIKSVDLRELLTDVINTIAEREKKKTHGKQ